jgi:hypothetical protein
MRMPSRAREQAGAFPKTRKHYFLRRRAILGTPLAPASYLPAKWNDNA